MPEQVAGHPIYATNDPAVIAEYERVMADRDRYVSLHARADSEAERYQHALEDIILTAESVLAAQRKLNQQRAAEMRTTGGPDA